MELDKTKVQVIKDEIDSPKPQRRRKDLKNRLKLLRPSLRFRIYKPTPLSTAPIIKSTMSSLEVMDKRYEHGEESLTEEEKETLQYIKINAASPKGARKEH